MKIRTVEFLGTFVDPRGTLPGGLPEIAFSGRSNVGKSSLINTLLRRTRRPVARVSATPGKTQGLNFYRVNEQFLLVDLPGFGYARVPARIRESWKPLVEGYLAGSAHRALAVVHLIDARRTPGAEDVAMLRYLSELAVPTLLAVTKIDKLAWEARRKALPLLARGTGLEPDQIVAFSSRTGEGRGELLAAVEELLRAPGMAVPAEGARG